MNISQAAIHNINAIKISFTGAHPINETFGFFKKDIRKEIKRIKEIQEERKIKIRN